MDVLDYTLTHIALCQFVVQCVLVRKSVHIDLRVISSRK
jgi:hypothetical protein